MKSLFLTGLFFSSLVVGCWAQAKSHRAVYEVPGFSGGDGFYSIEKIRLNIDGNNVELRYALPVELTGAVNFISASGVMTSPTTAVLSGPKSDFECNFSSGQCVGHYKNLEIDLDLVQQRLAEAGFSMDQIQSKLAVSRRFGGDSIGVIHIGSAIPQKRMSIYQAQ